MPNWCENTLRVGGPKADIAAFKKKVVRKNKDIDTALSLNQIIPMPKELEGTRSPSNPVADKDLAKAMAKWEKEKDKANPFNNEKPISVSQIKELIEKYGADNWYDWQVAHWGTKWDVNATLQKATERSLSYFFDSAWSPPSEDWLTEASRQFPTLQFRLEYNEPGEGFSGVMKAKGGEAQDECYQD